MKPVYITANRNSECLSHKPIVQRLEAVVLVGFDVNLGEGAPERVEDPLVVRLAERLEHDLDAHLVDAREEPGALVEDVLDRGALLVDQTGELGDAARPVAQGFGLGVGVRVRAGVGVGSGVGDQE